MYEKVLVPIDGSRICEEAFAFLLEELRPVRELILLQVIPPTITDRQAWSIMYHPPASWAYYVAPDWGEVERSRTAAHLEGIVHLLSGDRRWRCELAVAESACDAIVDCARAEAVDLIALCGSDSDDLAELICNTIAWDEQLVSPIAVKVFKPRVVAGVA